MFLLAVIGFLSKVRCRWFVVPNFARFRLALFPPADWLIMTTFFSATGRSFFGALSNSLPLVVPIYGRFNCIMWTTWTYRNELLVTETG